MPPDTSLVSRPPRPSAGRRPTRSAAPEPRAPSTRSASAAGALAALRAAGLGVLAVMVVVLVAWSTAADSGADAGDAVATGLLAWLAAHHAHLLVPGGELALTPLGLTALPVVLLHAATVRAGRAARVHGLAGVVALTSTAAATYAALAALTTLAARTDAVTARPVSAFVGAGAVGILAAGTGAVRAGGGWPGVGRRLPERVRVALAPAAVAVATLVATGALLAGGALLAHRERAVALIDGLHAGIGGGPLLAILCLAYLPTAAVWGLAYAVGPGFAVGAGTSVSVAGANLGAVPAFPLLAALPQEPGPALAPLALLGPLVAGLLAGLVAHRRGAPSDPGWRSGAGLAGTVGTIVAGAVTLLAVAGSGPAGPGRLLQTGPTWWAVGPLAGLEVAGGVALALLVLRRRAE